MKYDLSNSIDLGRFEKRVLSLKSNKKRVELSEIRPPRSLKQNAYFHVVVSLYGIHFGQKLLEVKTDFKREYGLIYEKNGKKYLKSTTSLDTKELAKFTEYIIEKAGQRGCYIPSPEEYLQNKYRIDNEIEQHKNYL